MLQKHDEAVIVRSDGIAELLKRIRPLVLVIIGRRGVDVQIHFLEYSTTSLGVCSE